MKQAGLILTHGSWAPEGESASAEAPLNKRGALALRRASPSPGGEEFKQNMIVKISRACGHSGEIEETWKLRHAS